MLYLFCKLAQGVPVCCVIEAKAQFGPADACVHLVHANHVGWALFQPRDMVVHLWPSSGPRSQSCHCTPLQWFSKPGLTGNSTMCCLAVQLGTQCAFVSCARPTKMGGAAFAMVHAPWRRNIYLAGEFLQDLNRQGLQPNPLFNCPGFSVDKVIIGVLHALDQGVTQEVCGHVMWEALEWLDWGSKLRSARCATMWIRLKQYDK